VRWTTPRSNSGNGECFMFLPKRPKCPCGPHRLLVNMYWHSSAGIKRSGREPNNSTLSSAEVKMLSIKLPLVLRFQFNEVKSMRLSGTDMYGEVDCEQTALRLAQGPLYRGRN